MKAILIGATGLVGHEILQQLLKDTRIDKVLVFARRPTGIMDSKLDERVVDFRKSAEWSSEVKGDLAFSALGTTRAQAGSTKAQYEVDYTFQANFAQACKENGVRSFVLISAMGANASSGVPYSRMKGELEGFVKSLEFESAHILRPGPLQGPREKRRLMEELGFPVLKVLAHLPFLRPYQPVSGERVARTAIQAGFTKDHYQILENLEIIAGLSL